MVEVPDEEQSWITRSREGDQQAVEALVLRYQKMIFALAYRMTGSLADAEDLTQETFIAAFNRLDSFRGESKFSSWLYRIATNRCLNWRQRAARRERDDENWSQEREGYLQSLGWSARGRANGSWLHAVASLATPLVNAARMFLMRTDVRLNVRRINTMGLLARIFGGVAPDGIRLDVTRPFWEASGEADFPTLLAALPDLLPADCVLYFEGGSPGGELLKFLRERGIPERAHVACATIWPKPTVFHLPVTPETISRLGELTRSCASPELAIQFHVYRDQSVLLEWHDAFTQPMLLSGELPPARDGWGRWIVYEPYATNAGYGRVFSFGRDCKPGGVGADAHIERRFP